MPAAPPPTSVPWGSPATPVAVAVAPTVVRTRVGDGILVGLAAAGIGGVLWWAISTVTELEWWHFAAVVVGLVVGEGVVVGARRGGVVPGLIAAVLSAAVVFVTIYFIQRSLAISTLDDAGMSSDIPLWHGFGAMVDTVTDWIDTDRTKAAGWLLAPIAALVVAGWPGRRPLLGRG